VDQQQQSRWRLTGLMWTVMPALVLIIVIASYLFEWKWTGFADRTLWDWLKLLLAAAIPAVLGFLGSQVQQKIYQSQQDAEEKRAQDEALQAYLDQIGQLMLDKLMLDKDRPLRHSKEGDEVRTLARARTLTVLARLDGSRKRSVLQFLYESGLITKDCRVLDLGTADLRGAMLGWAVWSRVDLSGTDLRGADLSGALLHDANLKGVELDNSDLSFARGIIVGELEQQATSLEGATMPNGQKYEEWLKSKGRGEDGENSGPS
jgi:hypothetical protein